MTVANILDPIHDALDPTVWENPGDDEPRLRAQHLHWIKDTVREVLEKHGYENIESWSTLYLTGSLTTYQYSEESDVDVSIFVNTESFPEWSRGEMIGVMISEFDGTVMLPGTTHPLQVYVVPQGTQPEDIYMPGLRSAYSLETDRWVVPPERGRAHDVQAEYRRAYAMALDAADKMELLLEYEPHKAVQYYEQIHRRRMSDQTRSKGDYSDSNIIYKFLENRGLSEQVLAFKKLEKAASIRTAADHQGVLDANRGQDLQGLPGAVNVPGVGPLQFGSHGEIQQLAQHYNQAVGIQTPHPTNYLKVNPQTAQQIAQEYEQMPHAPNDPAVQASYDALKRETLAQYNHAVKAGYNFEFYPHDHDPYPNSPREAMLDLHHNKHMYVYPTEHGYGTDQQGLDHPMLEQTGLDWGGRPVTYNDAFRAVHDFYGHAKEGVGFRADGEDNAYRQHASMFSPLARGAMAAETRGQNSWVNFGPHGEHNQTAGQGDTVYAPQKAGVMPGWTTDVDLHDPNRVSKQRPIVRKWVYHDGTGELAHTEFGRDEGEVPSHYQLAQQWGVENPYGDPTTSLGTISPSGWVQFESGGGNAKVRYRAQQALRDRFGDEVQGFVGGETRDPSKALEPSWVL
jgi:hypothetical protein